MDPTKPVTYTIIKAFLLKENYTQLEIHKETGAALSRVNTVNKWLMSRNYVERVQGRYRVLDPAGVIAFFPLFRRMDELLTVKIPVRGTLKEIADILPNGSIRCLDTALSDYSTYLRTNRVCLYYENPELVRKVFTPYKGGNVWVCVFEPDMRLGEDTENGITTKIRTLIDMACDDKLYLAKELFKDIWGLEID